MSIIDETSFHYKDSSLNVEGVPLTVVANKIGTPFYIYSASAIERNYKQFSSALSRLRHSISYAVKANSNIAVLKLLGNLGAGMDIVSSGEYLRAKEAGILGSKIVFSGLKIAAVSAIK